MLSTNFCFAFTLEASYPTLATGSNITTSTTIPAYLKYVFDFGIFIGFFAAFLSLAYAGVLYFLSTVIPNALASARDRISGSISGILILVLLYLIITTINPALSIFSTETLQTLPPPPVTPSTPGVGLYSDINCPTGVLMYNGSNNSPSDLSLHTYSIPNLSQINLDKQTKSVKIINDTTNNTYYFATLFENPNYRGKCLVLSYNVGCKDVDPFASSVNIYQYSLTATGDITIYRNPSFDKNGGYFTISSSDIQNAMNQGHAYMLDLNNTYFGPSADSNSCTVPKYQQDCKNYDTFGNCLHRTCPTLAGKNLGSIKIGGNYYVLAIYYNPSDPINGAGVTSNGPWNFCQAFPTSNDINNYGPTQINWEDIMNQNSTNLPNFIEVIPITWAVNYPWSQ